MPLTNGLSSLLKNVGIDGEEVMKELRRKYKHGAGPPPMCAYTFSQAKTTVMAAIRKKVKRDEKQKGNTTYIVLKPQKQKGGVGGGNVVGHPEPVHLGKRQPLPLPAPLLPQIQLPNRTLLLLPKVRPPSVAPPPVPLISTPTLPPMWPHQQEVVDNIFMQERDNLIALESIINVACGAGKTRILAESICRCYLTHKCIFFAYMHDSLYTMKSLLLALAPTSSIHILSAKSTLADVLACDVVLTTYDQFFFVASPISLALKASFPIAVFDEVHKIASRQYCQLLHLPFKLRLGATATPLRLDGKWEEEIQKSIKRCVAVETDRLIQAGIIADVQRVEIHFNQNQDPQLPFWASEAKFAHLLWMIDNLPGSGIILFKRLCLLRAIHKVAKEFLDEEVLMPTVYGEMKVSERAKIFDRIRDRSKNGQRSVLLSGTCAEEAVDIPVHWVILAITVDRSKRARVQADGRGARRGFERGVLPTRFSYSLINPGEKDFAIARRFVNEEVIVKCPDSTEHANTIYSRMASRVCLELKQQF